MTNVPYDGVLPDNSTWQPLIQCFLVFSDQGARAITAMAV